MAAAPHLTAAAETCLGVDATVPAKTTFLRRLDEVACLPSPEQVEAAGLLGLVARDGDEFPALDARVERQFLARLDDFLGRYWETAPADREAEWQSLSALAGHIPKYEFRLRELQAGLTLTLPADVDDQMAPVVRGLEVAFLQPAAQRSRTLADIRRRAGLQPAEMRMLADTFLAKSPAFEPALRVLGLRSMPPARRRVEADRVDVPRNVVAYTVPGEKGAKGDARKGWVIILFIMCFMGGIRAGCGGPSSSNIQPITYPTFPTSPTFPTFTMPTFPEPKFGGTEYIRPGPPNRPDPKAARKELLDELRRMQEDADRLHRDPFRKPSPFDALRDPPTP